MLHHITGKSRDVVLAAIEDHTAVVVPAACFSVSAAGDMYDIVFYLIGRRVIRCECHAATLALDLEEYSGGDLVDFKVAHKIG